MNTVKSVIMPNKVWPLWWLALSLAVAIPILIRFLGDAPDGNSSDEDRGIREEYGTPNAEAHFQFTPPIELSRLANEWEPQQALILSISFPKAIEDLEIARNLVNVLDVAHSYMDIYVFCDQEKHKQYAHFLSLISPHPRIEAILEKTHFVDSRSLLRWTRDFGPIFGFGTNDQLVTIDLVYRDIMKTLEEEALKIDGPLDPLRDFYDLHGDAMPSEVAAMLQSEYDIPVDIVRPSVSMDGGDFISDGRGNIFISRHTLVRNGGNRSELENTFRRYFGAKQLHILETLPGRAVPHLDMIVKFLDHETVLLPDFKVSTEKAINPYHAELNRKARSVIEKNERYLRKYFPNYKILKMPMPPILFKSRDEIASEAKQAFVKVYALDKGLTTIDGIKRLTDPQLAKLEQDVLTAIKRETPSADFSTPAAFDAVLRQYGQLPLDDFIDHYSEPVTRYRSYINSVFLHAKNGRQAFLVPRFTSSNSSESALLEKWESDVESVYRTAWPKAKIHWINCDSMVADLGFLHCSTITVPLLTTP